MPTQIRPTTLVPSDDTGALARWRLKKTLLYVPIGSTPIATALKPS